MVIMVPAVPVMMPVMIPSAAVMIPPVVAVPAAMAPVVMMASRSIPAMVATVGRLGDARAEDGAHRDGGSKNGLHRLTFPRNRQRSEGAAYAMGELLSAPRFGWAPAA
jgi:hypothetical protein